MKNLLYKVMDTGTQSFQEVLSELRSTKIGNDLPSPAEILHGRSLITGKPVTVDHAQVKAVLIGRQIKDSPAVQQEPQGQNHREPWYLGKGVGVLAQIMNGQNVTLQGLTRRTDVTRWCLKTLQIPQENQVTSEAPRA